jgi:uncharacterized protein YPO0396
MRPHQMSDDIYSLGARRRIPMTGDEHADLQHKLEQLIIIMQTWREEWEERQETVESTLERIEEFIEDLSEEVEEDVVTFELDESDEG